MKRFAVFTFLYCKWICRFPIHRLPHKYYNSSLPFHRESRISLLTKYEILKVNEILWALNRNYPDQISQVRRGFKVVHAILTSDEYLGKVRSNVSQDTFFKSGFNSDLYIHSQSPIGWVIVQLIHIICESILCYGSISSYELQVGGWLMVVQGWLRDPKSTSLPSTLEGAAESLLEYLEKCDENHTSWVFPFRRLSLAFEVVIDFVGFERQFQHFIFSSIRNTWSRIRSSRICASSQPRNGRLFCPSKVHPWENGGALFRI